MKTENANRETTMKTADSEQEVSLYSVEGGPNGMYGVYRNPRNPADAGRELLVVFPKRETAEHYAAVMTERDRR